MSSLLNVPNDASRKPEGFSFKNIEVLVDSEGEECLVSRDVYKAIGYEEENGKKVIQNLVPSKYKLPFGDVKPSLNQEALHKDTVFLIEPGPYCFLLRCKKPKAVPFTGWVVETVLPREVRKLTSVIEEKNNQQKISRLND